MDRLAHFEDLCRKRGLSLTVQRRVILQELVDRGDHPTADQIYDAVRERIPGLSRTTVYRVLDTLVRIGAARKLSHPDAVVRFDPRIERHHHLVCQQCGTLVDLEASAIANVSIPDTRQTGFKITDYSVSFTGICSRCRQQRPSRPVRAAGREELETKHDARELSRSSFEVMPGHLIPSKEPDADDSAVQRPEHSLEPMRSREVDEASWLGGGAPSREPMTENSRGGGAPATLIKKGD